MAMLNNQRESPHFLCQEVVPVTNPSMLRFAASTVLLAHSQPKLFIAQLAEHFQVQRLQVWLEHSHFSMAVAGGCYYPLVI